jgi:hypothetical protein
VRAAIQYVAAVGGVIHIEYFLINYYRLTALTFISMGIRILIKKNHRGLYQGLVSSGVGLGFRRLHGISRWGWGRALGHGLI